MVHVRHNVYTYAYVYIYLAATICRILYCCTIPPDLHQLCIYNIMRRIYNMMMIIIIIIIFTRSLLHSEVDAYYNRTVHKSIRFLCHYFVLYLIVNLNWHKRHTPYYYYQGRRQLYKLKLKNFTQSACTACVSMTVYNILCYALKSLLNALH